MYDLIKEFEGYRSEAYQCDAGVWTIGYGTTNYPDSKEVCEGDTCTEKQADEWLRLYISKHILSELYEILHVILNSNQKEALISLIYNIGMPAFRKSKLLGHLNDSMIYKALEEWDFWFIKGKINKGLAKRRLKEVIHFCKPTYKAEEKETVVEEKENLFVRFLKSI